MGPERRLADPRRQPVYAILEAAGNAFLSVTDNQCRMGAPADQWRSAQGAFAHVS
jgi:hypothetical protein